MYVYVANYVSYFSSEHEEDLRKGNLSNILERQREQFPLWFKEKV